MTLCLLQWLIVAVCCANNAVLRVRLFAVALVLGGLENALYDPTAVNPWLHVATGIARLLACAEAIWLLVGDAPRRIWGLVGIGIAASAGIAGFWDLRMQFNLNHPAMWRFFGVAWACAAIGCGLATLSNWRWLSDRTPGWMRWHGMIYTLYALDKVSYHFTPLMHGQKALWDVLWRIHWTVALCLFGAWLALWVVGDPASHDSRRNEPARYDPGKHFRERHTP